MSSRVKAYVLLRNDEQRFPASILAKEDTIMSVFIHSHQNPSLLLLLCGTHVGKLLG
jgi:hypothetical protein